MVANKDVRIQKEGKAILRCKSSLYTQNTTITPYGLKPKKKSNCYNIVCCRKIMSVHGCASCLLRRVVSMIMIEDSLGS